MNGRRRESCTMHVPGYIVIDGWCTLSQFALVTEGVGKLRTLSASEDGSYLKPMSGVNASDLGA